MIVAGIGLLAIIGICNIGFYEYRVLKGVGNPKEISLIGWKR